MTDTIIETRVQRQARLRQAKTRRALSTSGLLLTVALAAAWFFLLRPASLGGPADYVIISGHSMEPTLHTGDVVVALRQSTYRVGDVVVYRVPEGEPGEGDRVIHRIVGGSATNGYVLRGDNKDGIDPWRPTDKDILGKARVSLPDVGWGLVEIRTNRGLALIAGLTTMLVALGGWSRPRKTGEGSGL